MTCLFELSIALLITLLNGFFVMAEYSLVRIRKSRLDELIRQGKSRANTVLKMSEKLDTYLSATQLGITASSLLLGWFGGPLLAEMFRGMFGVSAGTWYDHSLVFACAFLIIVFLHVVFGISDHALHHFAADGAGLTGSQVSVVALLQVHVQGVRNFHLERVHRLLGLGNENVVPCHVFLTSLMMWS